MNVQRLLAHPEFRRERIHREAAVAVREEVGAGLPQNSRAKIDLVGLHPAAL
jgi:hypothetical protein